MRDDHRELVRFFLRKWSTIDLDEDAKALLKEDLLHVTTLLDLDGVRCELLNQAEHARSRQWFADAYLSFKQKI